MVNPLAWRVVVLVQRSCACAGRAWPASVWGEVVTVQAVSLADRHLGSRGEVTVWALLDRHLGARKEWVRNAPE